MSGGQRAVSVTHLFQHAREEILAAAGKLWPGESAQLGEQVPNLSSYVHRIDVAGRPLTATYSLLGESLVTVLRGTYTGWDQLEISQRRYVRQRNALLARQAQQLRVLAEAKQVPVCGLAGYHNGVLFTDAIPTAQSLEDLLLADPRQAPDLLRRAWAPLTALHTAPDAGWPVIVERGIAATFDRKFGGQTGTVHFRHLRRDVNPDVVEGLRFVVRRLRTFAATHPATGLTFGASPEHIVLHEGEPVYLDPGLHVASAVADLAMLASRLLLVVMARALATSARRHIVAGLTGLIRAERAAAPLALANAWMVDLLTLLCRDTANLLSTYLTAPDELPLPNSATAVLERSQVVMPVIEHVVTGLVQSTTPMDIWNRLAEEAVGS